MRLIDADSLKRHIGNYTFNKLDYLPNCVWKYVDKIEKKRKDEKNDD